ncbi:MAG: hypothetical protein ACJ8AO_05370, partial [Gemmatimonadaceae bacterium]
GLSAGLPTTDALRAAKLEAIRRGAPASDWAAFTVVGDPLVRVALRPPPRRPWVPLVALGALAAGLVALGAVLVARRRRPGRSITIAS